MFSQPSSTTLLTGFSFGFGSASVIKTTDDNWQTKLPTIKQRNKLMFNNSLLSDIKFVFHEQNGEVKTVPAHKYVLAISSPVFFSMFYSNIAEKGETIEITDSDSASFLKMLRYIYSDKVSLCSCEQALHVWYLANKYFIPSLSKQCVTFLDENVGVNEVLDVLRWAVQFEEKFLQQRCWTIIDFRVQTILKSEAFEELDRDLLIIMLKRDDLPVDEIELVKVLDRWAQRKCKQTNKELTGENKREVMGEDLFRLVRFPVSDQRKFTQEVLPLNFLTDKETVDVFKYFNGVEVENLVFPTVCRKIYPALMYLHRYESVSHGWSNTFNNTRFTLSVDKPIKLCGFSVFGTHKEKYDVDLNVIEQEAASNNLIAKCKGTFTTNRSLNISTEMSARVFDCLFDRNPVLLKENKKYEVQASVRGPDSYFGEISSENQVVGNSSGFQLRRLIHTGGVVSSGASGKDTGVFGVGASKVTGASNFGSLGGFGFGGIPDRSITMKTKNKVIVDYNDIRFTFETVNQYLYGTCSKGQIPSVIFMAA